MKRRQLLFGVFFVLTAPAMAHAQQRIRRIGWLGSTGSGPAADRMDAFRSGMRELGYIEGRHYEIVIPMIPSGDLTTLKNRAEELIAKKVDAIVATNTPAAQAFTAANREIPVFVASVADPVGAGLAASLARPRGTVTGLTGVGADLLDKRVEILRDLLPGLKIVGFVFDPANSEERTRLRAFEAVAQKLSLRAVALAIDTKENPRADFVLSEARSKIDAVVLPNSSTRDAWIPAVMLRHKMPAIYSSAEAVRLGGLLSYAPDFSDLFRRLAGHVDKVFKGTKPGDLPIEQPTKFELVVNRKTANALGIPIPQSILLRADRVIE